MSISVEPWLSRTNGLGPAGGVRRILALTHDLSGQPDKPPVKFTEWAEDLPGLVPDFTEGTPCSENHRGTRIKTA